MSALKRWLPFNAEQTVNILSEFGPLVLMFIVNAMYGISAGTWALIGSTVAAIVAMLVVLRRLPVFPLIASIVTIVFGGLTIATNDPMWVQVKVTIFNALFALFLFGGLWLNRNFFKYVFEKTFHYTKEGWDRFTWNFAWFFVFTAIANEVVRLTFKDEQAYNVFGVETNGVGIWIAFKIALIMRRHDNGFVGFQLGPNRFLIVGDHTLGRILQALAARRRYVEAAPPDIHLLLAPAVAGLVLVEPTQIAVMALVQRLAAHDVEVGLADLRENDFQRSLGALQDARVSGVETQPARLQETRGDDRLNQTLLRQVWVVPAGE